MGFIITPPSRITQGEHVTCAAEGKISNMIGRWITLLKPHEDLGSTHGIGGNVYSVTTKLENPGVYQCQFTDGKTKINATTMLPNHIRCKSFSSMFSCVLQDICSEKFRKIPRKMPLKESFFKKFRYE